MALPLESEIMTQIGLGQNYRWFNGSSSCAYVRRQAANKLVEVIQSCYDEGKEIVAPNRELCDLVWQVSQSGDTKDYELTKTWQTASEVISAHIHLYHCQNKDEQSELINRIAKYVQKNYLPEQQEEVSRYSETGW